jgi:hypothetical protein
MPNFQVSAGGVLTLPKVDVDVLAGYSFSFGMQAFDDKNRASRAISIVVYVDDANDNAPRFVSAPSAIFVDMDAVRRLDVVATFVAQDADVTSPNNRVRYRLVVGGAPWLQLDSVTGKLSINDTDALAPSDRELQIEASDAGEPVLRTFTLALLRIGQVGPPIFGEPWTNITISEAAAPGALVGSLPLTNYDFLSRWPGSRSDQRRGHLCRLRPHRHVEYDWPPSHTRHRCRYSYSASLPL